MIAVRSVACAAFVMLAGCTMCPDPHDYSGPVPNGSAPQNDFRARSNGILPIGASPRPWPPIVRHDGAGADSESRLAGRSGTPTPAPDAVTLASSETSGEPAEARSVLVVIGGDSPEPAVETASLRDPWAVLPDFGDDAAVAAPRNGVDEARADPGVGEPAADVPAVTVVLPSLTETPGWRQRSPR